MNKINNFFADHGLKIIIVISIITHLKACGIDSEVQRIKKRSKNTNYRD